MLLKTIYYKILYIMETKNIIKLTGPVQYSLLLLPSDLILKCTVSYNYFILLL